MSQQFEDVDDIVPLPELTPQAASEAIAHLQFLRSPLRLIAGLVITPILIVVASLSFFVVLADFAVFRLRDLRAGHPEPKGLWEF